MSDGRCFQFMHAIAGRIADHAVYGILPVVTEVPLVRTSGGLYLAQQTAKLTAAVTGYQGRSGLAVFVTMAHTERVPDTEGAIRTFIASEISVVEHLTANVNTTTGFACATANPVMHADDVAEGLFLSFLNWTFYGLASGARPQTLLSGHEGWVPPELRRESSKFYFITAFQIRALASWDALPKCYPPGIAFAGGNVVITPKGGSAATFTVDGTYPSKTDTTYTAPVAVTSGATVLSVGRLANHEDSDVAMGVAP